MCLESDQTSVLELFAKIGNSHLKIFKISLPIVGVGKQILYSCEKSIFSNEGHLVLEKKIISRYMLHIDGFMDDFRWRCESYQFYFSKNISVVVM